MGFQIGDFWDCTIKEFTIIFDGFMKRKIYNQNLCISHAYMTAHFARAKKVKKLDSYLVKEHTEGKQMSDEQMMKQCLMLNKLFGGEVIKNGN